MVQHARNSAGVALTDESEKSITHGNEPCNFGFVTLDSHHETDPREGLMPNNDLI